MKSGKPSVSVIIPHLNQPDMLATCLASLEAQSLDQVDDAVRSWDVVALIQRASSPTAMFSRLRPEARLVWAFDEGCRTDGAVGGVPRAPSAGFERLRTHRGYKGDCEHTPSEPVRRAAE